MALTANKYRVFRTDIEPQFIDMPVKASGTIYIGSAVTDEAGGGLADRLALSENFVGFAETYASDSSGVAGAVSVRVRTRGTLKNVSVTGASGVTDFGVDVYMTDDDTLTLTSSSTFVKIGKVERWITGSMCDVYFEGVMRRSI